MPMLIHARLRDHPPISRIQSLNTQNNQHSSQSIKIRVVKVSRHRRRWYNHKRHHDQLRSISTNHHTIQSTNNTTCLPSNKPIHVKDKLHSDSTHHQQHESTKLSAFQTKNVIHPTHITQCPSTLSHPSQHSWQNDNLEENITKKKEKLNKCKINSIIETHSKKSSKVMHSNEMILSVNPKSSEKNDGWPDWTSIGDEHHRKEKKKNKCSRPCVIAIVVATVLLAIAIAITLGIVVSKSKVVTNSTAILRWNTTAKTVAGVTGRLGNASNLLYQPFGVAIDYSNSLYIADWYNSRVQKYARDASFGITVAGQADGSFNSASNYLYYPTDVIVDSNGNMYITDAYNFRVQYWSSGSSSGVTAAGTGVSGATNNTLNVAYGMVRDPNSGILYISDSINHRVMRYLTGATSGSVVAGGNGSGLGITQLSTPIGLYFESSTNSLLIANYGGNNIVRWVIGSNSWTLVAGNQNGSIGNSSTELNLPAAVTLDPMGNMYVADTGNSRVQFFSYGQSIGTTICGVTSTNGYSSMLLNSPYSLTLDNQLNVYVSDTYNQRVQKFNRF